MAELPDGTLYFNGRSQGPATPNCEHCRAVSFSKDFGSTWTATTGDPALIDQSCQASVLSADSYVYFSNPASKTERVNMTVRRSSDAAKTWGAGQVQVYAGESA